MNAVHSLANMPIIVGTCGACGSVTWLVTGILLSVLLFFFFTR
jgi:hypothetical protein